MARADPARPAALAAALILSAQTIAAAADCAPGRIEIRTQTGSAAFTVEIADDPDEMARGLMFRSSLPRDTGMLFVYPEPARASFWMQNTMIPLDMIFIDDTGRVETIAVRRDTYSTRASSSEGPIRAVLEINGGLSDQLGIRPGAQAVHPAFEAAPADAACAD